MSNTDQTELDDASTGGGIGDIGRQPVDPSSENTGEGEPVIPPIEPTLPAEPAYADDAIGTDDGEDPDEDADSTQGQPS
jgi:hypothetical protein